VASGLGPPRPIQHADRPLRFDSTQTVPGASFAPALAQQGGVAVSRLDGRGVSLRARGTGHFCPITRALFRGPFLGSAAFSAVHYCRLNAAGPHEATQGELSSRMAAPHHWRRP
jgi:hypothetical protein